MSFPRYAEYVDSGVEWLEQVPSTWLIKRLGHFFSERREKVSDKEFTPLSVTKNGIVPRLDTAAKTQDGDNRKRVVAGDFVINSRSDRKGSSGLSALDGSVSLICIVLEMKEVFGRYAHHLLRSTVFQEEFYRFGKGIVADLWSTNFSEMKNILIPVPSRFEQTQIARFLDHETAKIDALIAEQKRLIKLLQEKRQAVISHAVTKGLDPSVPMKDSGVEWLGEVPAHWEVTKLGYVGSAVIGLTYSPDDIVDDGGVIVLRSTNIQNGKVSLHENVHVNKVIPEKLKLRLGDILICSRNGSKALIGKNAVVDHTSEGFTFGAFTTVFRSRYNSFLRYIFNSQIFSAQSGLFMTTTVNQLTTGTLNQMQIPLPPEKEQLAIERFLDQQVERLDNLSSQSMAALTLLQERRSALISAAVTGKIDVRDWQPPADESAFGEDVQKAGMEASA